MKSAGSNATPAMKASPARGAAAAAEHVAVEMAMTDLKLPTACEPDDVTSEHNEHDDKVGDLLVGTPPARSRSGSFLGAGVNDFASDPKNLIPIGYHERSYSVSNVLERMESKSEVPADVLESVKADVEIDFHMLPLHALENRYKVDVETGISESEIVARRLKYGVNILTPPQGTPVFVKFLMSLISGFGLVLWFASLLCFLAWKPLGDPPDSVNLGLAFVILIVIFLQGGFSFYQDRKSSKVLESLNKMLPAQADVRRGGQIKSLLAADLVVGDIVLMKIGEKVPADVRLLTVFNFKVDKSTLTGESDPINCTDKATDPNYMESRNMAFFGSNVVEGTAIGIVVQTGNNTVMGKIASLSSTKGRESTLSIEIHRFVKLIVTAALTTGVICMIVWAAWLKRAYPTYLSASSMVTNVIALIVAFIPDGLPVSLTLTLTLVAKRMYKNNVLVKDLKTIETLGSVNLIASDKTGTLTMNKMTVVHAAWMQHMWQSPFPSIPANNEGQTFKQLLSVSALCNSATPTETGAIRGDATDSAIYSFCSSFVDVESFRQKNRRLAVVPFNSKVKYMMSIHKLEDGRISLMLKGAPEMVMAKCKYALGDDGLVTEFTPEMQRFWQQDRQNVLGSQGERVLAFCERELPSNIFSEDYKFNVEDFNFPVSDFTFVGLLGLIDPPRREVPPALAKCKAAGVQVMMVTGDHPSTAVAIARQCGIITSGTIHTPADFSGGVPMPIAVNAAEQPNNANATSESAVQMVPVQPHTKQMQMRDEAVAVTGADLSMFSQDMWDWVLSHEQVVFARTTPEHKLQIVMENQKRKRVVAVTGDGVNDAPALKKANVGVAMGAGSEVSKEAAHVILLDNNFASLVRGIEEGRLVFDNLKKVLLFLMPAGSFSEMLPILANVFLGMPLPLSAFLMIVICIGTDVFPSLALVSEKAESGVMSRKPRDVQKDHLADSRLLAYAYCHIGMIESFAGFLGYFWYMSDVGARPSDVVLAFDDWKDGYLGKSQAELDDITYTAQSIFFFILVLVQFGTVLAVRTRQLPFSQHNPFSREHRNLSYIYLCALSAVVAVIVIWVPWFNDTFNTRPFPAKYLSVGFGFAIVVFLYDDVRKRIALRYPKGIVARMSW